MITDYLEKLYYSQNAPTETFTNLEVGREVVPTPPQRDELTSISQRIWNLSRLSFDGTDRTNFLYRQDLHRHFVIDSGKKYQYSILLHQKLLFYIFPLYYTSQYVFIYIQNFYSLRLKLISRLYKKEQIAFCSICYLFFQKDALSF